jgi:hypothetical protein
MNNTYRIGALILLLGMLGCTTVSIQELPCPPRPLLHPITINEQLSIDPQVLEKIVGNQIELKVYATKLRARANCSQ